MNPVTLNLSLAFSGKSNIARAKAHRATPTATVNRNAKRSFIDSPKLPGDTPLPSYEEIGI